MRKLFVLFLLTTYLFPLYSISAEESTTAEPKDFYGYWKIEENAGDTCYVLIKRGKRATGFWSGAGYSDIITGKWKMADGKMLVTWKSGFKYLLEKAAEDKIYRYTYSPDKSVEAPYDSKDIGNQVDRKSVGSLIIDSPNNDEENPVKVPDKKDNPHTPLQNPYIGYWEIVSSSSLWGLVGNDRFFIHFDRGGQVEMALKELSEDFIGQKGTWNYQNDEIIIKWPSGHNGVFKPDGKGEFLFELYDIDDDLSDSPDSTYKARKAHIAEVRQLFKAGATNLLSIEDIIGCWIRGDSQDNSKYLQLERWGKARKIVGENTIFGFWSLNGLEIVIRWNDDTRTILEVTTNKGIIQKDFSSEATDSFPTSEGQVIHFKSFSELEDATSKMREYYRSHAK